MLRRSIGKRGKNNFGRWKISDGLGCYIDPNRPRIIVSNRLGRVTTSFSYPSDLRRVPSIGGFTLGGETGPGGKRPNCHH